MDAIVTGKTSGKIFKANITYDVSNSQAEVLYYNCPDHCNAVRIISKDSEKESVLFEFRKFYYEDWRDYTFSLGSFVFYKQVREDLKPVDYVCNCYYSSDSKQFTFNSSPQKLGDFVSSIEIGTLE